MWLRPITVDSGADPGFWNEEEQVLGADFANIGPQATRQYGNTLKCVNTELALLDISFHVRSRTHVIFLFLNK